MKRINKIVDFYRMLFLAISAIILILSLLFESHMWLFYSVVVVWVNTVIYSLQKVHHRTALLVFQIAFFNFLLGGTLINYLETGESLYAFENNILVHTYVTLYISQLFIFVSYRFLEFNYFNKNQLETAVTSNITLRNSIQITSLFLMFITYIPYVWEIYDKINFVTENSYEDIYLRSSSNIPYVIQKISQFFVPAFFVFLGTMPTKKKAIIPIAMYLFAAALSVFVGARADFARSIMIIFFYFIIRDRWRKKDKVRWIGKKELVSIIILIPILLLFLYSVGNTRWDRDIESNSTMENIKGFVVEQGVSVSVLHYAKLHEEHIPNNNYVSGPIIKLFAENPVVKQMLNIETYDRQSVESALYGDRFGDIISYLAMPYRYLQGFGMGSSYIAEVYHSAGYIGLIAINILFGIAIILIDKLFGRNIWISAFALMMLYRLIYAPRAATLDFISNTFNITHFAIFIGIYLMAKLLIRIKSNTNVNIVSQNKKV